MNPTYYFYVSLDGGEEIQVFPIYKDDLAIEYTLETNQRFYRKNLSSKLTFVRNDYQVINNAPFDTTFVLKVYESYDNGVTKTGFYTCKFMKTDCEFDDDDLKITIQTETLDQYNDTIAGLEKEYNLIELSPEINPVTMRKRPMIQLYIPGDSVISCFIGGSYWEQECDVVDDSTALRETYWFSLASQIGIVYLGVREGASPDYIGTYVGKYVNGTGTTKQIATLYKIGGTQKIELIDWSDAISSYMSYKVYDENGTLAYYKLNGQSIYTTHEENNIPPMKGFPGSLILNLTYVPVWMRLLLDVETIQGLNTHLLPTDDIVPNNRNYRRAIGYNIDCASISSRTSVEPTKWGRMGNGLYYAPPYNIYGDTFYPIARSRWSNVSFWFSYNIVHEIIEQAGWKEYTIKTNYPLFSCIKVLLNKIAPGIQHEGTAEYSQFLYSGSNPISHQFFRLLITPKSNILAGEFQQPAQKAPITLQYLTNMLRDCFRCYWYIEDNKFKIEHVKWFRNGGSYNTSPVIGTDLTTLMYLPNGKDWGFDSSKYSFDKVDMPERYQFQWMDEVTTIFQGLPIEVVSKYVMPGKIEDINVSNFTSDIDYMLLAPDDISKDGYGLFACTMDNLGQWQVPIISRTIDGTDYLFQNGYLAFSELQPNYYVYDLPATKVRINNELSPVFGVERKKKQTVSYPSVVDPNPMKLVKTHIGNGQIEKITLNLCSRLTKVTLKYDTDAN